MIEFLTHRDLEASLWQSAVEEILANRAAAAVPPDHPLARVAARAGGLIAGLKKLAVPAFAGVADAAATVSAADDPEPFGAVVARLARAFPGDETLFRNALEQTRFTRLDPLWLEAAVFYYTILRGHRDCVHYRSYTNLNECVIEGVLPGQGKVALFADWGTGTDEAVRVLKDILGNKPNVLIHLGDIYYSGLPREVQTRFLDPLNQARAELQIDSVPTFTLAGNHDMYSGGAGYYGLLDQLGQPASYFCLRNQHWQLVAVDTGYNSGIRPEEETFLREAEVAWVRDKVENAGGRKTILLSHHPLFSAYEAIGTHQDGVNSRLLEQFGPLLPRVTRWFWGHEHDLIVYGKYLSVQARCIGHGAVPVGAAVRPRQHEELGIPTQAVDLGTTGFFLNHGYALLEFNGASATASYRQVGGPDSYPPEPL